MIDDAEVAARIGADVVARARVRLPSLRAEVSVTAFASRIFAIPLEEAEQILREAMEMGVEGAGAEEGLPGDSGRDKGEFTLAIGNRVYDMLERVGLRLLAVRVDYVQKAD